VSRPGPRRGSRKSTTAQITRRRDATLRLYNEGWGVTRIAEALDVHTSTTVDDLDIMRPGRVRHDRSRPRAGRPDPVDWRTEPSGPEIPDAVLRSVQGFLREMKAANYRNAFAHAVNEAGYRKAETWLESAAGLTAQLAEVGEQLRLILTDAGHRRQMAGGRAGRDDLRQEGGTRGR
jgi:hypothetical protein